MNKKQWPIVALLAAALLIGCLRANWPFLGGAPAARELCLGDAAIPYHPENGKDGEWRGAYIWFGGIKWRVLEKSPDLYLLADSIPEAYRDRWTDMPYWEERGEADQPRDWRHSPVRTYLNTEFYAAAFTGEERGAMKYTDRSAGLYYNPEDKLFLPELGDVTNEDFGFGREADGTRRYDSGWWLRDRGGLKAVSMDGKILDQPRPDVGKAVRPACCLDDQMVVYSRDAAFLPGAAPSAQLMDFKGRGSASGEWVLALSSADQHVTVDSVRLEGDCCVVDYSDAAVGQDNYLAAVITDQNRANVFYYGRIARTDRESSGEARIALPGGYKNYHHLMVFSERGAGERETVCASKPVIVLNGKKPAAVPAVSAGALPADPEIQPLNMKISRRYDRYLSWTGDDYRAADEEEKFQAGTAILLYQELLSEGKDRLIGSAVHEGELYAKEHPEDIAELARALFGLADLMEMDMKESMDRNYQLAAASAVPEPGTEIDLPGYTQYLDYTGEMYAAADDRTKGEIMTAAVAYTLKYRLGQDVDGEALAIIRQGVLTGDEDLESVIAAYESFFALHPKLMIREMMNYVVD